MVGWLEKNIHYALNKPSSNTAVGTSWQSGFGSKNSKVHFFFSPPNQFSNMSAKTTVNECEIRNDRYRELGVWQC